MMVAINSFVPQAGAEHHRRSAESGKQWGLPQKAGQGSHDSVLFGGRS